MVPPATMLATKNRFGCCALICAALAVAIVGCTPAGTRALLDGRRLLEEGRPEEAVKKMKLATSLLNTNAQAWNYLGLAYHRAGQPTNAAAAYQQALDLNRDLLEARYNLGCLWLELNKPELARAEFTSYTLRRGNSAEGWLKLGTAQLRSREPAAADKSFREVLRLNPNNVEALNGLGLVQLQRKRPRDAIQYFNAALKVQPNYRPAMLNHATVSQQHLDDRSAALQKYRDYLALKPRPADWEAVNVVAQWLEQPPPAPPAPPPTNQLVVAPAVAATNVTKPATNSLVQLAPAKTQFPPPAKKIETAPPATPASPPPAAKTETSSPPVQVATKPTATPPPAQSPVVEVVTLPPETVIRTATDASPNKPTVNQAPVTQPRPADPTPAAVPEGATPGKPGFFSRMNPANLFRGESKSGTTSPEDPPRTPDLAQPTRTMAAVEAKSLDDTTNAYAGPRYAYVSPTKPAAGNRREAERAYIQAQQSHRANRLDEAAEAYRQATQADPAYFEAHFNLALVALESRNYLQSLAAWESALAIQPESVDARYNFALTLKAANYPADAANELSQILAANANETRAHLVLGNLWAGQLDDPAQARKHYLRVLELDPRHPQATTIRFWLVAHPL